MSHTSMFTFDQFIKTAGSVELGYFTSSDDTKGSHEELPRVGFEFEEGDKDFSFAFDNTNELHGTDTHPENTSKQIGLIEKCDDDYANFGGIKIGDHDDSGVKQPKIVSGDGNGRERHSNFASLELLKNYGNWFRRHQRDVLTFQPKIGPPCPNAVGEAALSTEEVFKLAGELFIQSSSQCVTDSHSTNFHFSNMPKNQIKDVQLAVSLFLAAESVAFQQFERATRLLNHCDILAAQDGSPVQRVVYYFSEALRERIDRTTVSFSMKGLGKMHDFNIEEAMMSLNPAILASQLQIPFAQVYQLTAMQAILENVAQAEKVHVIDFGIKCGVQWTILLQALATRETLPIQLLKITAVSSTSRDKVADTGTRLTSFAKSLNLRFAFNVVMIDDMLNLHENLFQLEDDETTAVYVPFVLRTLLSKPDRLEHMMKVVRSTRPCVMVMIEVEANHNSPAFGDRFTEALFYFSAYFDCLAICLGDTDPNRMVTESVYFSQGIRNIIATEGEARTVRNVKIEIWRGFLARFEFVEGGLSSSSLYQAGLVLKQFNCGQFCSLRMSGEKSLVIEWKGTPIISLSAWKFA